LNERHLAQTREIIALFCVDGSHASPFPAEAACETKAAGSNVEGLAAQGRCAGAPLDFSKLESR
jgi:hypothetical protein